MSARAKPAPQPPIDDMTAQFTQAMDMMMGQMVKQQEFMRINTVPAESRGLYWLQKNGSALMSELAKGLGMPLSSATNLVNRLVEKGYVCRERSEQDRRIVNVNLSANGRRFLQRLQSARDEAHREVLSRLSPAEQRQLIDLLQKTAAEKTPA